MDIKIVIGAQIDSALEGFRKLKTSAATMGKGIKNVLGGSISNLAGALGIGLGVAGVVAGGKKILSELDSIGKGADRLGVTTKAYQELRFAASKSAVGMEQVEMAIGKAGQAAEKAADGDKKSIDALEKLGLKWQDLVGMSPDQQFEKIGTALSKIEDAATRNSLAIELFGKSGMKLMPLLNSISDLRNEANNIGVIIDDETVRRAEAVGDAFDRIGDRILAIVSRSGFVQWIDDITKGVEAVAEIKSEEKKAKDSGFDNIKTDKVQMGKDIAKGAIMGPVGVMATSVTAGVNYLMGAYDENSGSVEEHLAELEKRGYKNSTAHKIANRKGGENDQRFRVGEVAKTFTSDAKTLDAAVAELKAAAEKKIGRELNGEELKALEPKIAEMKTQFDAIEAVRSQGASDAIDKITEENKQLDLKLAGDEKSVKQAQILYDLKKRGLELTAEELAKLQGQLEAQEKLTKTAKKKEADKQIKDQGDDLDRRIKRQQLVMSGKDREVFVQDELDKADKTAKDAKTELTPEQRDELTRKAGELYDLQKPFEASMIQGRQNPIYTDSLQRMGGYIGPNGSGTNYQKTTADTLKDLKGQVSALYDKIPNRTESQELRF